MYNMIFLVTNRHRWLKMHTLRCHYVLSQGHSQTTKIAMTHMAAFHVRAQAIYFEAFGPLPLKDRCAYCIV